VVLSLLYSGHMIVFNEGKAESGCLAIFLCSLIRSFKDDYSEKFLIDFCNSWGGD